MKNLGRLGSVGSGDSGLEKQSFPRALPDTLDRILGKVFYSYSSLTAFWLESALCGSALVSISVADPYVFGPPGSGSISQRYLCFRIRILLSSSKNTKENLDSYCFVTSFLLPKSTGNKQENFKKIVFCWRLKFQ